MALMEHLEKAWRSRAALRDRLAAEETDAMRLFHGVNEGRPGLSIDAYGPLWLAQVSGKDPLTDQEWDDLRRFLSERAPGPAIVAERAGPELRLLWENLEGSWNSRFWVREFGCEFAVRLDKSNRDPQLFLDFRAAKRRIRDGLTPGSRVLNLFSYTCSVGCLCAHWGASKVLNVDFSEGNLRWGQKNFRRNRLLSEQTDFLAVDCFHCLWSLTGNRKALQRARVRPALEPSEFDLVVVDPPPFSKGRFATVDLARDPESILVPAWEVVAPGGSLLAANNLARVSRDEFSQRLERLLQKSGRDYRTEWVEPDPDFPSRDGEHPLKVVLVEHLGRAK